MDRDFLIDLFAAFGPVTIRRMFSGFGISVDGVTFALALREAIYLRADASDIPRFEAERSAPFQYQTRVRTVTVGSYWRLPERLYDDPDELAQWARAALAAAQRAALSKATKAKRSKPTAKPRKQSIALKMTKRSAKAQTPRGRR
jgi:DNA transformation protein